MSRIYLSPPDVGPQDRAALLRAFDSGWVAPLGPDVDAFESELAAVAGVEHAVALNTGTAALHLVLLALGVASGDRVITSTLTFAATANAIAYCGAEPVFIDSDSATWNMDPDLLEEELREAAGTGRLPAAVIPVDLFGQCADYQRILETSARFGVPVVEDAAEALGATFQSQAAGSFGAAGVFSFNGNKILTTSGGGALVTDSEPLAARIRYLATQAREPVVHYEHLEIGYNYRMSNLLAALGRAQLASLPAKVARRRAIRAAYQHAFVDHAGIGFMPEAPTGASNAWLSVITVDESEAGFSAQTLREHLEQFDIESRPIWKPMHLQPVFAGARRRGGAVAERLFATGLCLPSGSSLTEGQQERVVGAVRDLVDQGVRTR